MPQSTSWKTWRLRRGLLRCDWLAPGFVIGLTIACGCTRNAEKHAASRTLLVTGTPEVVDYGFTTVRSVIELEDRRVLVLDYLDRSVHVLDFDRGTRGAVGRIGQGPGEFSSPRALHRWRTDSIMVVDDARFNELLVLSPQLVPVATRRTGHEASGERFYTFRTASDTMGNVYAWIALRSADGRGIRLDSAAIERTHVPTQRRDTVGRLSRIAWAPGGSDAAVRSVASQPFRTLPVPFAVTTQFTVRADGVLVLLEANPYRLKLLLPDGTRRVGPDVLTEMIPLSDTMKARWRTDAQRPQRILSYRGGSMIPDVVNEPVPVEEPMQWPTHLPPFGDDALFAALDGNVFVQRHAATGAATPVDVFDELGRRTATLLLPIGRRLAGVGAAYLYLVRSDDDDMLFLERWRRPM